MSPSTSLVATWILLLLAISVLGYETMRMRRRGWRLPEVMADLAVTVGLIGLLTYQFKLFGNISERAVSISELLILGGVAVGLIAALYYKLRADPDKSSI